MCRCSQLEEGKVTIELPIANGQLCYNRRQNKFFDMIARSSAVKTPPKDRPVDYVSLLARESLAAEANNTHTCRLIHLSTRSSLQTCRNSLHAVVLLDTSAICRLISICSERRGGLCSFANNKDSVGFDDVFFSPRLID